MLSEIGFVVDNGEERTEIQNMNQERTIVPRKSVVEVYFPDRQMTLSYFNDKFDLLVNDVVFQKRLHVIFQMLEMTTEKT